MAEKEKEKVNSIDELKMIHSGKLLENGKSFAELKIPTTNQVYCLALFLACLRLSLLPPPPSLLPSFALAVCAHSLSRFLSVCACACSCAPRPYLVSSQVLCGARSKCNALAAATRPVVSRLSFSCCWVQVIMHIQPTPAKSAIQVTPPPPKPAEQTRCCTIL